MTRYTKEKSQETILAMVTGLIFFWFITHISTLLYISFVLLMIAILSRALSDIITFAWLKLSSAIGWVMSKILLSIVFYGLLFPMALMAKIFGKSNLQLKRNQGESYYSTRKYKYSAKDLENPW